MAEVAHHERITLLTYTELKLLKETPAGFMAQLEKKSAEIDRKYEADLHSVEQQRQQLVTQQKVTLLALVGGLLMFVAFIGLASIVTTHRIVAPDLPGHGGVRSATVRPVNANKKTKNQSGQIKPT
jgi:hypothetical protein